MFSEGVLNVQKLKRLFVYNLWEWNKLYLEEEHSTLHFLEGLASAQGERKSPFLQNSAFSLVDSLFGSLPVDLRDSCIYINFYQWNLIYWLKNNYLAHRNYTYTNEKANKTYHKLTKWLILSQCLIFQRNKNGNGEHISRQLM